MVSRELVIVYDAPSKTHAHLLGSQYLAYYLKFFEKIHVLYWSNEGKDAMFPAQEGKISFYPYCAPYTSSYFAGIAFMLWIGKTLWALCGRTSRGKRMVIMPVIPLWAGLPALVVGKIRRAIVVLRIEADKIQYLEREEHFAGTPRVMTFLKICILRLIYHATLPFYDAVIALSAYIAREAGRYKARNIHVIPIPIDLRIFHAQGSTPHARPILLYVGQIKKMKGVDDLIGALELMRAEGEALPLTRIVGDTTNPRDEAYKRDLQERARGLPVEFLGWQGHSALPALYRHADILVLPSHSEALGRTVMEAMACGLPTVASRVGGIVDLVEDSQTGFLVEPGDSVALKAKISFLAARPALREQMGKRARTRIEDIMRKADTDNNILWKTLCQ